ncbi:hypothetical protein [Aneurinibacillus aneurinilyticus]|jgi:hypothetical protein|uniref:Uncharacterized protein n=1 Tax=Aneurinibacillus aneurinilyticus TaxID=1391 RepID=A0A848CY25_ANEAE|nr:hypothetical protein [Aneurinibacillus aneurinilyticus]NMF00029.1 hypothetical protein [Aneurinibacillus aneurinilyticus]
MKRNSPLFSIGDTVRERGRTRLMTVVRVEDTPILRWYIVNSGMAYDEDRLHLVKRADEETNDVYEILTKLNEEDSKG